MIESAARFAGLRREKIRLNVHKHVNTSPASIPIALADAVEQGRAKTGNSVGKGLYVKCQIVVKLFVVENRCDPVNEQWEHTDRIENRRIPKESIHWQPCAWKKSRAPSLIFR